MSISSTVAQADSAQLHVTATIRPYCRYSMARVSEFVHRAQFACNCPGEYRISGPAGSLSKNADCQNRQSTLQVMMEKGALRGPSLSEFFVCADESLEDLTVHIDGPCGNNSLSFPK